MPAIVVDSLRKSYDGTEALRGISFDVADGEIFGFLGPNGAGKTTTIKILTTLIAPSAGRATVLGYDILSQGAEIRRRIGVVQQKESYELNLSVEKSLDLYGLLWNVSKERRVALVEELLEKFGLTEDRRTKAYDLSIGMRKRLQVAREFVHDMDLIFLDEPTTGLDPIARRAALDFFREKAKSGWTIFFTTHMLEEAEYLCDRIALINEGKIVVLDSPGNIKRRFGSTKTIELKVRQSLPEDFQVRLRALSTVESFSLKDDRTVAIVSQTPEEVIAQILRDTQRFGLEIFSIYVAEPSLEEAFISVMTREVA